MCRCSAPEGEVTSAPTIVSNPYSHRRAAVSHLSPKEFLTLRKNLTMVTFTASPPTKAEPLSESGVASPSI